MGTVWQDNVAQFVTRRDEQVQEERVRAERTLGIQKAIRYLRAGRPDLARQAMAATLDRQLLQVGIGVLQRRTRPSGPGPTSEAEAYS